MNEFAKILLITAGINALLFVVSVFAPIVFLLFFIVVALEVVCGFPMLFIRDLRERGGAFLVAGGISLLIGLSVCSSSNFNFH